MSSNFLSVVVVILFSQALFAGGLWYELSGQADDDFNFELHRGTRHAIQTGRPFYPANVHMSEANKAQIYNHTLWVLESQRAAQSSRDANATHRAFSEPTNRGVAKKDPEPEAIFLDTVFHFLIAEVLNPNDSFDAFNEVLSIRNSRIVEIALENLATRWRLQSRGKDLSFVSSVDALVKKKIIQSEAFQTLSEPGQRWMIETAHRAVLISAVQQVVLNRIWNLDPRSSTFIAGRNLIRAADGVYDIQILRMTGPELVKQTISASEAIAQQLRMHDIGSHMYWIAKGVKKRDMISQRALICPILFL